MSPGRRVVTLKKIARDYGQDLAPFIDKVMKQVVALGPDESPSSMAERRRETCGLLWAATLLAIESSALRQDQSEALAPLLFAVLAPTFRKHWNGAAAEELTSRAQKYLAKRDARSHVKTAAKLVECLFDSLEVPASARRHIAKRLAALMAHRTLGDIHRLNEAKLNFRIQLSLAAVVLSPISVNGLETLMRMLRLI